MWLKWPIVWNEMNVIWNEEHTVLWGWDDEYIILKDIEVTQENGVIWGRKENCGQVINMSLDGTEQQVK